MDQRLRIRHSMLVVNHLIEKYGWKEEIRGLVGRQLLCRGAALHFPVYRHPESAIPSLLSHIQERPEVASPRRNSHGKAKLLKTTVSLAPSKKGKCDWLFWCETYTPCFRLDVRGILRCPGAVSPQASKTCPHRLTGLAVRWEWVTRRAKWSVGKRGGI